MYAHVRALQQPHRHVPVQERKPLEQKPSGIRDAARVCAPVFQTVRGELTQQIQTLALSEKATNKLKEQQEEQAKGLAQRLETTERLASREQQKMSAKISRMKQLSDLALGVQSKGAAGAAAGEVPKGTKERNRMLLYDNVRKG